MTGDTFLQQWRDASDSIAAHTSGSTGKPKNINLLKNDMAVSARATCRFFNINADSFLVCPLSTDYIAGKMMVVRAEISGADLRLEQPSNRPLANFNGHADLVAIVPSQIEGLIDAATHCTISNVIVGGSPMSRRQEELLYTAPFTSFATYGMTETCSHVALRRIQRGNNIFTALPGITFSVDNRGCLVIASDVMSFGRITTNDMVEIIDSTRFIWKGRYDNVIITGGLKVHPEELELELSRYIDRPFYISGTNDDKWGSIVTLNIEGEEFDTAELMQAISVHFDTARQMIPRIVVFHKAFNRTSSGKIIRAGKPAPRE